MKRLTTLLFVLVILATVTAACGAPATPAPAPTAVPAAPTAVPAAPTAVPAAPTAVPAAPAAAFKVVVIGKSVHPYWSNVEKGVRACAKELGLADDQAIFFVPPKEDVAAQTQTMETYIAQGATGIAIAPSDPNALEPVMKKAADAGIFVTTLDTPPVENSVSLVYIGTDNFSAGKTAGEAMKALLPNGGKVGIGRGSDTALNALQRTDGFKEAIKGTQIVTLEPVNDKEDAARALELANSVISANPDLAGAFGVYAYNGPAWATAIKEANKVGAIKLVSFDATTDIINGIKEGVIDATVAQREFDMGCKSVQIIYKMATEGKDKALTDMGAVNGVIDTGVDVITAATLKDYEATLDKKGIPHEWNTQGWTPPAAPAAAAPAAPGAPADAMTKQADTTNLFPDGIGQVDCKGVNLVVATQTGPQIASPVENFWKQWGDKTGGTVEVQTFPFGDLFAKIRTGYLSGSSPFDIVIYASDWAGDIMGPGYVLEIPQKYQDAMGYGYLIPTYRDRILAWGGKTYAAPYDGDSHMIYYRADLLNDPTHQAAFKAQFNYDLPVPPKTWNQYRDIATYFQGKTIDGQTIYGAGTAFRPKGQSYWTYLGLAASYAKAPDDPGYFFDTDTMEPRINNPGFVEALDMYSSLVKVGPPDVLNWDVGNIRSAFPAGQVVLGIDWGDVGPLASDAKSSAVVGKWGSALEPGVDKYYDSKTKQWVEKYNQAPFLAFGGWVQSVSKTTKSPDCALDFISFMGSQNMSAMLVVYPGSGVNPHYYSDGNNPEPWLKLGMTEQEAKEYLGAVTEIIASPNAVVDLRITGAAEYFDALDTQLARAVTGEVTSQQALDQVAKDWNAITDRLGRDQQLKLYRQQLGLPTQ